MKNEPQRGELRRALAPLMDQVIHSTARLVLHLTASSDLDAQQLKHHIGVLKLFIEAIDALP